MECRDTIPMFKVAMNPEVDNLLLKTIHSGWIGQGEMVKTFENCLSNAFDHPRVLSLSSGTHGLTLALRLIGVKEGDEVITTPLTCTATNMPILQQGADIVWADVENDFNIDPMAIKHSITEKTKAIIVVHWGGYPCNMHEIGQISHDTGIPVIEDCAHAYLSEFDGHKIGDCMWSEYAMFSFQAIKHLTSGDGGALCISEFTQYERAKLLRWYGIDREGVRSDFRCEEDIQEWGYKFHMNDINAVIGLQNMKIAFDNVAKARENALYYDTELSGLNGIDLPQYNYNELEYPKVKYPDRKSSYWLYTMLVESRSDFCHMMGRKGIAVSRVHERNDKHACFKKFKKHLPGLDSIIDRMICIPVGWWVDAEAREYIVETIKEGW